MKVLLTVFIFINVVCSFSQTHYNIYKLDESHKKGYVVIELEKAQYYQKIKALRNDTLFMDSIHNISDLRVFYINKNYTNKYNSIIRNIRIGFDKDYKKDTIHSEIKDVDYELFSFIFYKNKNLHKQHPHSLVFTFFKDTDVINIYYIKSYSGPNTDNVQRKIRHVTITR